MSRTLQYVKVTPPLYKADPAWGPERLRLFPSFLRPLFEAAEGKKDLHPTLTKIVGEFGFSGFGWSFSPIARKIPEVTMLRLDVRLDLQPPGWIELYVARNYFFIDQRAERATRKRLPIIWDQESERGAGAKMDELLDAALSFGIGSGMMYLVPEFGHNGVFVNFTSPLTRISQKRRSEIERQLPYILTFTRYFTDVIMRPLMEAHSLPRIDRSPLTERERKILGLVAHGLSNKTIAKDLAIAERTVQLHVDQARVKLGASNRQEAVARAVRHSLVANNTFAATKRAGRPRAKG